jgi:predicted ABC-type transport system involved in lysophospholipase L1 biosynthesis ATPase subunit
MAAALVSASGLVRVHGSGAAARRVVDGVDLDVDAGELVAIVGPSGSGKSTLVQLLAGFDRPTAGSVTVAGRRIDQGSERARARFRRTHVGFVFQSFRLVPELTAWENVLVAPRLAGDASGGRVRARALFEGLGLAGRERQLPAELSGGEQQRVALARALVMAPRVLLADEPTGNLDAAAGDEVMRLLRSAATADRAVVMVTHDARHAAGASRVLGMRDGLLVA